MGVPCIHHHQRQQPRTISEGGGYLIPGAGAPQQPTGNPIGKTEDEFMMNKIKELR